MALAIHSQGRSYYRQGKLEKAKFEALRALEIFEKLGAQDTEDCRSLLRAIEEAEKGRDGQTLLKEAQEGQDAPAVSFPELYHVLHPLIPFKLARAWYAICHLGKSPLRYQPRI